MLGWHSTGPASYAANDALVEVIVAVLADDSRSAEIQREYLKINAFVFDLYRGTIFSTYREPIWNDRPESEVVEKSIPIANLSWGQKRRVKRAVEARLNRYLAESIKTRALQDRSPLAAGG